MSVNRRGFLSTLAGAVAVTVGPKAPVPAGELNLNAPVLPPQVESAEWLASGFVMTGLSQEGVAYTTNTCEVTHNGQRCHYPALPNGRCRLHGGRFD